MRTRNRTVLAAASAAAALVAIPWIMRLFLETRPAETPQADPPPPENRDPVEQASWESFPASDPPAW